MIGVEGRKGTCYQWKEKGQCSKGDQCSFRHESNDRAQKPEHTAATPSEPALSRGRSVSRKRSIRSKSNHGSILRQPCRYFLEEYWHRPECQLYETKKRVVCQETRVRFLITRLMNNQIKGRRKATSQKEEKVKTKALWLPRKAYHNWVVYHKTRMHSLLKERKSFG